MSHRKKKGFFFKYFFSSPTPILLIFGGFLVNLLRFTNYIGESYCYYLFPDFSIIIIIIIIIIIVFSWILFVGTKTQRLLNQMLLYLYHSMSPENTQCTYNNWWPYRWPSVRTTWNKILHAISVSLWMLHRFDHVIRQKFCHDLRSNCMYYFNHKKIQDGRQNLKKLQKACFFKVIYDFLAYHDSKFTF